MKSDAQKKASGKWEAKAYDKILLRIRKDTEPTRETITAAAAAAGLSLNAYIMQAISDKLEREAGQEIEREPFFD